MSATPQPILRLSQICRLFPSGEGTIKALDDINLEVWPGEFVAIMGQSGSGKSTLMNIIGCLDRPTSGSYCVLGREASSMTPDQAAELRREFFGFIFQRYNLLSSASALENIEMPAIYAGKTRDERLQRSLELLQTFGLGQRADHKPSQLSGGQQQRVAVARALVNNPRIILADEPTGALDSKSGADLMQHLKSLHQQGHTIILITHDQQIASYAERIVRLADGVIVSDSTTNQSILKTPSPTPSAAPKAVSLVSSVGESVKIGLRALHTNKFRTALTLLGVVIGVASVIVMLAVGQGSKQKVLNEISAMGTNLLSVRPGAAGIRGGGDIVTLTPGDAEAILALPNVSAVVPERGSRLTARVGNIDYATTVQGVSAALPPVRDWPILQGSFFSERDIASFAPVALLGRTTLRNLFPDGSDPIGQLILVKNVPFEVIGVMSEKGASSWGNDQDDVIFVPITTGLIRLFGRQYLNAISVKVTDVRSIEDTQAQITALLLERHRTEDFSIRSMAAILETATSAQNTLTVLLGAVAAISLLVGGIGVMNIMLVSVRERTREIGIRMATGARMHDILLQFNTEATVVCVIGGLIGLLCGFSIGVGLQLLGVEVVFTFLPPIVAFSCAVVTGVVFGYLPAHKAARLDPVMALASD